MPRFEALITFNRKDTPTVVEYAESLGWSVDAFYGDVCQIAAEDDNEDALLERLQWALKVYEQEGVIPQAHRISWIIWDSALSIDEITPFQEAPIEGDVVRDPIAGAVETAAEGVAGEE